MLFPGDGFITCPWQKHGSPREVLDLGEIFWVVLKPNIFEQKGKFSVGSWSRLSKEDNKLIGNVLAKNLNHKISKAQGLKSLFVDLKNELEKKDFGYVQRISSLAEEFLINAVRLIQNRENRITQNKNWFLELDSAIKNDLSKKWTLEELSKQKNIGVTTLTKLVKEYSGYTPAKYITYLRLNQAKELLRSTSVKLTDIALECGFYSSQHFSSTFSKWVGKSPLSYRKSQK